MSEDTSGYRAIPEEEQKKARTFFEKGKSVAGAGQYDYAIDMYLSGLAIDPDNIDAHVALRDIALMRKINGGKPIGMMQRGTLKRPSKDDKQNLLNAEKLLAYEPGNTDYMVTILQNAFRAGYYDTVLWIGPILTKANEEDKNKSFDKFIILKDIYKALARSKEGEALGRKSLWRLATNACQYAVDMRAGDLELPTELKNLGAEETMEQGKYGTATTFRDSVRNMDEQQKLMENERGVQSLDIVTRQIREAEAEYAADPNEAGKLSKLVDVLEKTDDPNYENRAVELLEDAYIRTKAFRFRRRVGQIHIKQYGRHEASVAATYKANPTEDNRKALAGAHKERLEFELKEYELWLDNYPTETGIRFDIGKIFFELGRIDDSIPVFQQVQNDPKYRTEATIRLAHAFFSAKYIDEADEVLDRLIKEYQIKGDARSKEMYYMRARTLEEKKMGPEAMKLYSQVAQWDFNYRDVQVRIKKIRADLAAR